MRSQYLAQHINRQQKGIHHFGSDGDLVLAYAIEQGLQDMGHFGHVGETECAAAPLDGMRRPEDGIQLVRIRRIKIDREQQAFHAPEMFDALLKERLVKLAHVDGHRLFPGFTVWGILAGA